MTFNIRTLLYLAIVFLSICHTMQNNDDIYKRKRKDRKNCPKGHGLEKGTVKKEGYECDLCKNSIGKEKSIYSCDDCNYHLCRYCAKNEERNGKKNGEIDNEDKVFMSDEEDPTNEIDKSDIESVSNDDTTNLLNQLEVTVKPGSLGIRADWKTGAYVTMLKGCQKPLEQLGKENYWKIVSVDGKPYTRSLIKKKVKGNVSYHLTFLKYAEPHIFDQPITLHDIQGQWINSDDDNITVKGTGVIIGEEVNKIEESGDMFVLNGWILKKSSKNFTWKKQYENDLFWYQAKPETRMDWYDNLDERVKGDAVELLSQSIDYYNGLKQQVFTDMETEHGILPAQTQQLYEFLYSKKNETRMDWYDNLDERVKGDAVELLSQGIKHYNGFTQQVFTDMETEHGILPAQTQQLYEFLYSKKNDKKIQKLTIEEHLNESKSNDYKILGTNYIEILENEDTAANLSNYATIGDEDNASLSTDATNSKEVVTGMTGRLIYQENNLDFEVRTVNPKNKLGKYFIRYLNTKTKPEAEWLDLDLQNFSYKSYDAKKCHKGKKCHEDKIVSLKNADGSEFNKNCQSVLENSLNLAQPLCTKETDNNQDEKTSNVRIAMKKPCLKDNKDSEEKILSFREWKDNKDAMENILSLQNVDGLMYQSFIKNSSNLVQSLYTKYTDKNQAEEISNVHSAIEKPCLKKSIPDTDLNSAASMDTFVNMILNNKSI